MRMAEYIERAVAIDAVSEVYYDTPDVNLSAEKFEAAINAIPTADVAPVVYGRWGTGRFNLETGNYEEQCIRCRNFSKEYGKPYCPNCGAKMDGGDNNAAD